MGDDVIVDFLAASLEDRIQMILGGSATSPLRAHLGQEAFDEYLNLAQKTSSRLNRSHLGADTDPNVIIVPDIMGSMLKSNTLPGVWWLDVRNLKRINDLRLSSNGHADADRDHRVEPFTIDIDYDPFLVAMLKRDDFGYRPFPYDWRKPIWMSAPALRSAVIAAHQENGGHPVNLVAHSMGGMIIRSALMEYGEELWPKIGRIAFVGTPHYGSPAIGGYLKFHLWGFELLALLGKWLSRETFRSLWGALQLLPAPRGVYPGTRMSDEQRPDYTHPCANFDLYDVAAWELDLSAEENAVLQTILNGAADYHRRIYTFHTQLDQQLRDRMLVIAGVGYKTLFRLDYEKGAFGRSRRMRRIKNRKVGDLHREGDGRVPVASALLENVGATRFVRGVHGGLLNRPEVYFDVLRWFNGEELRLPRSISGALGHHLASEPTSTSYLDGTGYLDIDGDDPGFLDLSNPSLEQLSELDERARSGLLPEFRAIRLL